MMPTILKTRVDGVRQKFHISPLRPKIKKLYSMGLSSRKVGKELSISHARVLKILSDEKIDRRSITKIIPNKNYKKLTPERAYIYGVMCGDGCVFTGVVHKDKWKYNLYVINLAVKDKDFIEEFIRCVKDVYGITPSLYYQKRNKANKKWSDIWIAKITRKEVYLDLSRYDFGTQNWKVPREVLKSNNDNITNSFLKGFYDSEGSVSKGLRSFSVSAHSTNKKGILMVKKLLKSGGINSTKIFEDCRPFRKSKTLFSFFIIRKKDLEIFLNRVGFNIQRKQNKLKEYLK